jgi:hypothetical protein
MTYALAYSNTVLIVTVKMSHNTKPSVNVVKPLLVAKSQDYKLECL